MPSNLMQSATAADSANTCVLCQDSLLRSTSRFDTVVAQRDGFRLLPALGMLVPGYFLLTTASHEQSMAQIGEQGLGCLEGWLIQLTRMLAPVFGDYFFFEHGDCASESGGSCIDHAHLHLIPLAHVMRERLMYSLVWKKLSSFEALHEYSTTSYLYLGIDRSHYVFPKPGLGSQWVRRLIGQELGRDDWDWAVASGEEELSVTLERLPVLAGMNDGREWS